MKKTYDVIIEKDSEGWYVGSVPELPGCHTQAKSLDILLERMREAIELCEEEYGKKGNSEFIGIQRLSAA